jgi:asparagine synthase (glutamine-hydrolysing)
MCGIAGIVDYAEPPARESLEAMTRVLAHRGPDDEGFHSDGPCALGFRRLSIIDLHTGHQPMTVEHAAVVFNGEIYNFRELRSDLERRGRRFQTTSDTEVLLNAYLEWGLESVPRLDGMFSFALWDARAQRLVCARDRFGKKPFYYAWLGRMFLFASELKGLLAHPACPRAIDAAALRRYLAFEYVPAPHAIFKGVRKLREAHSLVVDPRGPRTERYFALPERSSSGPSADDAVNTFREKFGRAVRKRLVSDVPLGVFLSGGIDSTAVAAFAAKEVPRLKTFSISFEEGAFDESGFARRAAAALGTEHSEERLSAARCLELMPHLAEQLDEPFADSSYVPTHLLSLFTRKSVTVALGGDAADELFAGYDTFVAHPLGNAYARLPRAAQDALEALSGRIPASSGYMNASFRLKAFTAGAAFPAQYRHQAWLGSFTPPRVNELLRPAWRGADVYADIDDFARETSAEGLDWTLRYYLRFYLCDDILTKVDRASMAASLEVRAPFLDTELVQWIAQLPLRMKMRGLTRKWLLRRALKGIVPDEVLHRRKHGFNLPIAAWFRGALRPMLEDLLSRESLDQGGIFEPNPVRRLMEDHFERRSDNRKQLWTLAMFELWRRRWAPRPLP